ncbi:DUF4336 domain-containing protein [Hyphomicrobium sp.]|uniref:DUF4336 domain-containing protein n=1 Tax=Hyphomicrobium sp. TaxID=82 RepID=UPI002BD96252|nr:DUF4336 domain-containing protein [Hyphomicrobium sp.]HVZ03397.1 DUF4336 domain-containing protein [Hyphomicrobium sp.]
MSNDLGLTTYPPLDTLKSAADEVWLVDGPAIRFGPPGLKMPFPTRMTIIRVGSQDLFVHSPTKLTPELMAQVAKLGLPRWIVSPNRLHYWWIPDWKAAFPEAEAYLAPRVVDQAGTRIDFTHSNLDRDRGYPWDDAIATLPVTSSYMTEVVFFHRPSRTLVLTDLIENFEPKKLSLGMRLLSWLGGCLDPNGSMPRDMRLTFRHRKPELRAAVETMISWGPERIILAHGRWYERNGTKELRRAFGWAHSDAEAKREAG